MTCLINSVDVILDINLRKYNSKMYETGWNILPKASTNFLKKKKLKKISLQFYAFDLKLINMTLFVAGLSRIIKKE